MCGVVLTWWCGSGPRRGGRFIDPEVLRPLLTPTAEGFNNSALPMPSSSGPPKEDSSIRQGGREGGPWLDPSSGRHCESVAAERAFGRLVLLRNGNLGRRIVGSSVSFFIIHWRRDAISPVSTGAEPTTQSCPPKWKRGGRSPNVPKSSWGGTSPGCKSRYVRLVASTPQKKRGTMRILGIGSVDGFHAVGVHTRDAVRIRVVCWLSARGAVRFRVGAANLTLPSATPSFGVPMLKGSNYRSRGWRTQCASCSVLETSVSTRCTRTAAAADLH